jgi:hypothetical protein
MSGAVSNGIPDASLPPSGYSASGASAAAAGSFPSPKKRRNRSGIPLLLDRTCGYCKKLLTRKDGESRGHFNTRRFCPGVACRAAASRITKPIAPKNCKFCETLLVQRETEPTTAFRRRKHCDLLCAQAGKSRDMKLRDGSEANFAQRGSWESWPEPVDAGREAELYGSESYGAPERVVRVKSSGRPYTAQPGAMVFSMSTAAMAVR